MERGAWGGVRGPGCVFRILCFWKIAKADGEVKELLDRWKLRPKTPKPPIQPPAPIPPHETHEPADEPTIAEAPPSAVRGAEGMMNVPLPEPPAADGQGPADRSRSGTR